MIHETYDVRFKRTILDGVSSLKKQLELLEHCLLKTLETKLLEAREQVYIHNCNSDDTNDNHEKCKILEIESEWLSAEISHIKKRIEYTKELLEKNHKELKEVEKWQKRIEQKKAEQKESTKQ